MFEGRQEVSYASTLTGKQKMINHGMLGHYNKFYIANGNRIGFSVVVNHDKALGVV